MPGNSLGIYGGFSSHIPVPSIDLCEVKNRGAFPSPTWQSSPMPPPLPTRRRRRADLQPGDNVIVIGITGGVGQYMGQMVKALGAKTVIGIARNKEKLERSLQVRGGFCDQLYGQGCERHFQGIS